MGELKWGQHASTRHSQDVSPAIISPEKQQQRGTLWRHPMLQCFNPPCPGSAVRQNKHLGQVSSSKTSHVAQHTAGLGTDTNLHWTVPASPWGQSAAHSSGGLDGLSLAVASFRAGTPLFTPHYQHSKSPASRFSLLFPDLSGPLITGTTSLKTLSPR